MPSAARRSPPRKTPFPGRELRTPVPVLILAREGIDTVRRHGYRGSMRGECEQQLGFSLVRPDLLVPEDHPIRTIKMLADAELRRLSPGFDQMYSRMDARRFRRSIC